MKLGTGSRMDTQRSQSPRSGGIYASVMTSLYQAQNWARISRQSTLTPVAPFDVQRINCPWVSNIFKQPYHEAQL